MRTLASSFLCGLGYATSSIRGENQNLSQTHLDSIKEEMGLGMAEVSTELYHDNFPVAGASATCESCDHKLCALMDALGKNPKNMFRHSRLGGTTPLSVNLFVKG
jgi:hypothetical protein